jgi:hypothetical protein
MTIQFEWDDAKARTNFRKHGVALDEAATAFFDSLSVTIVAVGSGSSARAARPGGNERAMRKPDPEQMRPEYDFSSGVRGKYVRRLAKGANVVVLDRDVAKVFPTSKAVNDALRALAEAGKRFSAFMC